MAGWNRNTPRSPRNCSCGVQYESLLAEEYGVCIPCDLEQEIAAYGSEDPTTQEVNVPLSSPLIPSLLTVADREIIHTGSMLAFAEMAWEADEQIGDFLNQIAFVQDSDGHYWKPWVSTADGQLLDHGADCRKCGATAEYGLKFCPGSDYYQEEDGALYDDPAAERAAQAEAWTTFVNSQDDLPF